MKSSSQKINRRPNGPSQLERSQVQPTNTAPSARKAVRNNRSVPRIHNQGSVTIIEHREFLTDLASSISFLNRSQRINPANSDLFPWLYNLALNFEEYHFDDLVFEFVPTSGSATASTNAALGSFIMATDYNVAGTPFLTKQQMESYEGAVSTVPFYGLDHRVICSQNPLATQYCRDGTLDENQLAPQLYDLGLFQYATKGMQVDGTQIGELWVRYKIRLYKPRLNANGNFEVWHGIALPVASATGSLPFGTTGLSATQGSFNLGVVTVGGGSNTFVMTRPGKYLISMGSIHASGSLSSTQDLSYGANIQGINIFNASVSGGAFNSFLRGNAALQCGGMWAINVLSAGVGAANTVTCTGPTGLTGGNTDVMVIPLPWSIS